MVYNETSRDVSPASTLSTRWLSFALEKARSYSHGRLLDVGCGSKPYQGFFSSSSHIGIDWSQSIHQLHVDAKANAEAIPFASQVFDVVLCTEVLEHLPHPSRAMDEMARVLRLGGYLILSVPFVHMLHELPHDYFRFTHFGLRSLLEDANLELVQYWPRGGIATVVMDLFGRISISFLQGLIRRVPKSMRSSVSYLLTTFIIVWPQKIFAAISIGMAKKNVQWKFLKIFENSTKLTLGYVCVAIKSE